MEIQIPKINSIIRLTDYAPEFGEDATIQVWVNPPRRLLVEFDELLKAGLTKEAYEQMTGVIAQLWNCPPEDVTRLVNHSAETDPVLFEWLITKTFYLIREHRTQLKKN